MRRRFNNKNKITVITLLFCIFILAYFCTIVYSATSTTMNISGLARARIEADIRVTDFSLSEISEGSVSNYEEFSKNSILFNVKFTEDTSYVVYKIEVTNYSTREIGILNITGLQDGLSYELVDYNLKDKICNTEGLCSGLVKKEFYIKVSQSSNLYTNQEVDVNLFFEFRPFVKISYVNLVTTDYPLEIMYGESLSVDIKTNNSDVTGVNVSYGGVISNDFSYVDGVLKISSVTMDVSIEGISYVMTYSHKTSYQTFTVPYDGIYKIELWGASGGYASSTSYVGRGGYTSGYIKLNKDKKLYVYVGSQGEVTEDENSEAAGGWNGGGACTSTCGGGGGATDIRANYGSWSLFSSLRSRIMVAAGGAGENNYTTTGNLKGGAAGGLNGYLSTSRTKTTITAPGATQILGGIAYPLPEDELYGEDGSFGKGGAAGSYGGGGGGGYYGGAGGVNAPYINDPEDNGGEISGTGGSSFISGHNGCNAVASDSSASNLIHTGSSLHYTDLVFFNTKMVDGQGYEWTNVKGSRVGMPKQTGTGTMNGNLGDGYAKISLISMTNTTEYSTIITNLSYLEGVDSSSENEVFTENIVTSSVNMTSQDSTITYAVDVTNFGERTVGLLDVTGLPENMAYEVLNYNLKDRICNDSGQCNFGASKTILVKIKYNSFDSATTSYDLNLTFNFKPFYTVTYNNFPSDGFQKEVFYGESVTANVGWENAPGVKVLMGGVVNDTFSYYDGALTVPNVTGDLVVDGFNSVYDFYYTGTYKSFTIPYSGVYKVELWGASGGYDTVTTNVGKGGYTSGNVSFAKELKVYVYVGGQGGVTWDENSEAAGGWNGGGACTSTCGGGGGSTDIRLSAGTWSNFSLLKTRIMVAAGGAGENNYTDSGNLKGGAAGGLNGYSATSRTMSKITTLGATQTAGGISYDLPEDEVYGLDGSFGKGGYAGSYGGGGGGGYYGGGGGVNTPYIDDPEVNGGEISGNGGSSFISGHDGCDAITETSASSKIVHTGQSVHYSGYSFTDTKMIDGQGYEWTNVKGSKVGMPKINTSGTMYGNLGDGFAKITLVKMMKE